MHVILGAMLTTIGVCLGLLLVGACIRVAVWLRYPPRWLVETAQCTGALILLVGLVIAIGADPDHFIRLAIGRGIAGAALMR